MNDGERVTGSSPSVSGYPDWDVAPVIEQIWSDLGGTVARPTIRQELSDVILRFESAPIQTYVPIFARRRTVERLRNSSPAVTLDGDA